MSPLRILAVVAVTATVFCLRVVRVTSEDMLPSIAPGDWLILGPGSPSPGEVFVVHDPNEPGRDVLRRVVGMSGHRIRVAEDQLEVDGARARIREMGRDGQRLVLSENNAWLIRRRLKPSRLQPEPTEVPEDAVWLLADARDLATDSRWWGSIPTSALGRQVWLRLGASNHWRSSISWHAMDGPWYVPPPS